MSRITVPVSFGELIDKLTILEIKSERIEDTRKLRNIHHELKELGATWSAAADELPDISDARAQLKSVNEQLWETEDLIRSLESKNRFDGEFVELARTVYKTNDLRSKIKKDINLTLGSELVEEKSYLEYD